MAVKDVVQQAKNSRLGKAIRNLSSDARTVAQPYAQSFAQAPQQMGRGVGGAIRAPFDMYFNSRNAQIDNSVSDTLRAQEQRFMSQGNYSAARDRSQLVAGIQDHIADRQITMGQQMNKDRNDAAFGTAGTVLQLLGAKGIGLGGFAGATAVTGGLGYGITRVMGGSNDEALAAAGTGAGKAMQYRGINKVSDKFFTNPLMRGVGQQGNMPVRVGFGAGVNALANIGEDQVVTRVNEGREPTGQEIAQSGAVGAVMGGFSQGVATRQYTKQIEENQRRLVDLANQAVKNNKNRLLQSEAGKALKKSINDYMNNFDEPVSKLKRKIGIQPASVIKRMYNDLEKTGKVAQADIEDVRKFWGSYSSSPKLAYHMTNEEIVTDLYRHARGTLSQGGFVGKIDDTGKLQFDGNYQRGDIKTLQTRLDELLGTKSFNFSGKWQAELPARQLAVKQIESYAEQGDEDAIKYLSEIRFVEDQLANAQIARTQPKGTSQPTPLKTEAQKYGSVEEFIKARKYNVYHGSDTNIEKFDLSKAGSNTDSGMYGKGIYFSSSRDEASTYARKTGNVSEYYLDLKNPYVINNKSDIPEITVPNKTLEDIKNGAKNYSNSFTKYLQDRGYDGVIDNVRKNTQYVVFNPDQINTKSQLTDIYNQAKGTSQPDPLVEKAREYKTNHVDGGVKNVEGTPVKINDNLDTFIHKDENNNWVVSESSTGRSLSGGGYPTQKHAIDATKAMIDDVGIDGVKAKIDELTQAKSTPATGIQEGTTLTSLQPETGKSSRTKIATQETQKSKLQTFRGKPIEPTGLGIQAKKAGKGLVVKTESDASSKIIISHDKKYAFNINKQKLQLNEAQSKELDSVVEVMRPVLEGNKGKTLTKQEIINGGRKAQVLVEVVGRDEAKQFSESLQASRNLLRSEQAQVGITPKFLEQLEVVSSVAADTGRRLQAFNIGAEDITIKEKLLQDILKTGADIDDILKAGKEVDWNNAKEVTDFYRKFKPATLADKLDEFRYTNMLSSPNTHINNVFSNFLQTAILAPVEKTVRGGVDFAQSKLTGKEQEYFARQGVDYARGYWKALPEAFDNFKKTLAGNEGLTRKPDIEFIPTSTSKLRQIYTFPLQALEASDQFFRTLVKGGEIESLKTEGITGAKASKIAEQQADYRTFRQAFDPDGKLGQNYVLKVFDKWNVAINRLRNVPGGKWLVPFFQTPANIFKQGIEYSPLGLFTIHQSREPATQMAKTIIGSTVFTGAYAMASSGLTTWDTPTNATEKAEFYAAGLQPYSMKIGGIWVSYSKIGPLAYPIAMASALKWAQDNGGDNDALTTMGTAFSGTLGFFADQSYVRGIGDIIDALRGDEYKQARGLSNIPAQMIPYRSFMGWVARQVDTVRRKSSGGKVPEQIGKSIVSQIPFASQSLEAHQTPFGEESLRQFPTINAFSPLSISKENPKEKEYYDARQKLRNQNKEVKKVLDKIEAGEGATLKINTDGMLAKQVASLTKKKVEAGIEVTQQELETAYLSQPLTMPKSNRYEKSRRDTELYSSLSTIDKNEYLTEQQKTVLKDVVASELGKTPRDLQIYSVAKEDNNSKTMYAYDQIDKSKSFDDTMRYLVNGRKPVNGKILVSDGVIDNLVADGVIPYALGKDIKEIDLNEDGTRKGKIKSRKGGRSGGGSKKSNAAQLKAFNDLGEDLKKIKIGTSKIRTTQSQQINTKGLTFSGR